MSKSYGFRAKANPEWTAYDYSAEYRNRSMQRGLSTGRTSPYKSEFDLDGTLHRRSTFYSPPRLSPRSSRAFLAAKAAALGLPRSGIVSDWSRESASPSNLSRTTVITGQDIHSGRAARGSDVDSPQPCAGGRRASAGRQGSGSGSSLASSPAHDEASRHKDLRRKMVFDLHKEIDKSAHTTHLEEISDMDKITDICFNNLRVMMENKKHRKFLHHMNNNAVAKRRWHLESSSHDSLDVIDFTNNASGLPRDVPNANAKKMVFDGFLARKASIRPADMILAVSPIDPLKVRGPKLRPKIFKPGKLAAQAKKEMASRDMFPDPQVLMKSVTAGKAEHEDPAVFFLAELEDQMEISKKEGGTRPVMKSIPLLTPEEVLACHYLRLNQDQVASLEEAIRKKGADPGIHVHMDVTNYDVFSEVRRLRNSQTPRARFQEVREEIDEAEEPGSHTSSVALAYPPTNSATTSGKKGGAKKG